MKEKIVITQGQDLFDVATNVYGGVEHVFLLLEDNPKLRDINSNVAPGEELFVRPELVSNDIKDYYTKNRVETSSGLNAIENNFDPEGFDSGFEGGED